jgi:hypothetical protein
MELETEQAPPNGRSKHTPKRSKAQRESDLLFIERLWLRKKTHAQIAEELNKVRPYTLSRQQVAFDCKKLLDRWRKDSAEMIAAAKTRELTGLDEQERELWEAWEKSKLDAERKTVEQTDGDGEGGKRNRASVTKEGQCGDAVYQRLILDIRDRRAKLLGLDEPTKTELSGTVGQVLIELPDNGRDVQA